MGWTGVVRRLESRRQLASFCRSTRRPWLSSGLGLHTKMFLVPMYYTVLCARVVIEFVVMCDGDVRKLKMGKGEIGDL